MDLTKTFDHPNQVRTRLYLHPILQPCEPLTPIIKTALRQAYTRNLLTRERVNNLNHIYQNDSIETRLLNKQHYLDFISFHLSKIDFKSNTIDQKKHQITKEKTINRSIIRILFYFIFIILIEIYYEKLIKNLLHI